MDVTKTDVLRLSRQIKEGTDGKVSSPAKTTSGNFPQWDSTDGTLLKDGMTLSELTTAILPTDQGLLDKIKTVDGSGSGLDADTVDGAHSSNISKAMHFNYSGIANNAYVYPPLGDYNTGYLIITWYGGVNLTRFYHIHSWVDGARFIERVGSQLGSGTAADPAFVAGGGLGIKNTTGLTINIAVKFIIIW